MEVQLIINMILGKGLPSIKKNVIANLAILGLFFLATLWAGGGGRGGRPTAVLQTVQMFQPASPVRGSLVDALIVDFDFFVTPELDPPLSIFAHPKTKKDERRLERK